MKSQRKKVKINSLNKLTIKKKPSPLKISLKSKKNNSPKTNNSFKNKNNKKYSMNKPKKSKTNRNNYHKNSSLNKMINHSQTLTVLPTSKKDPINSNSTLWKMTQKLTPNPNSPSIFLEMLLTNKNKLLEDRWLF
jgi:hypothetical protein